MIVRSEIQHRTSELPLADEPATRFQTTLSSSIEPAEAEDELRPPKHAGPSVLDDWIVFPSMGFGILVTTALPIFLGQRICLPVLSALVLIPMFIWALREGRPRKAIQLGLFWAVVQSAVIVIATVLLSDSASQAVVGGVEFRSEWLSLDRQWLSGAAHARFGTRSDSLGADRLFRRDVPDRQRSRVDWIGCGHGHLQLHRGYPSDPSRAAAADAPRRLAHLGNRASGQLSDCRRRSGRADGSSQPARSSS